MTCIQGFVVPVPLANKEAYIALARQAWTVFRDHGAMSTMEAWGDDIPDGTLTDFKRAVQVSAEETVVFSWIVWPDKATCEAAKAEMMNDERMKPANLPFDGRRMIYGGFAPIFEATRSLQPNHHAFRSTDNENRSHGQP